MSPDAAIGIARLDKLLGGLRPGDSIVFQKLGIAGVLQEPITLESLYAGLDRAVLEKDATTHDVAVG